MKKPTPLNYYAMVIACTCIMLTQYAAAQTPQQTLLHYEQQAGIKGDPQKGKALYSKQFSKWSCASCHTNNPTQSGEHAVTKKPIKPMAVSVNASRFTDLEKSEKWFTRNCKDVMQRECSSQEKADITAWLIQQ